MTYIHVVNGDSAAASLTRVLAAAGRADRVLVLRDDLAVGPLRTIDDSTTLRANFWQRVLGHTPRDINAELDAAAAQLRALVGDDSDVVAWHGQSAGDQLTLRRLAYRLRTMPQRLNEIVLSTQELPAPPAFRGELAAVASFPDAALAARLTTIAPISILRIGRLGLEWQELKQLNNDLRRWRNNTFQSGTFAELDALIVEYTSRDWQPCAALATIVGINNEGFFVTDTVVHWRCSELVAAGRLEWRHPPEPGAPRSLSTEVRRAG